MAKTAGCRSTREDFGFLIPFCTLQEFLKETGRFFVRLGHTAQKRLQFGKSSYIIGFGYNRMRIETALEDLKEPRSLCIVAEGESP